METTTFIQLLLGVVVSLLGFLLKELWGDHKKLREDMTTLALRMPTDFASKSELYEVRHASSAMEARLNSRIDKSETTLLERMDKLGDSITKGLSEIWKRMDQKADK